MSIETKSDFPLFNLADCAIHILDENKKAFNNKKENMYLLK
jgi:hypothetical protein